MIPFSINRIEFEGFIFVWYQFQFKFEKRSPNWVPGTSTRSVPTLTGEGINTHTPKRILNLIIWVEFIRQWILNTDIPFHKNQFFKTFVKPMETSTDKDILEPSRTNQNILKHSQIFEKVLQCQNYVCRCFLKCTS